MGGKIKILLVSQLLLAIFAARAVPAIETTAVQLPVSASAPIRAAESAMPQSTPASGLAAVSAVSGAGVPQSTPATLPAVGAGRVNAADHPAFWLWSGVKATPALRCAQTVYLHQGEVLAGPGGVRFQPLGLPVGHLAFPQVWLTVRFTTLDVPEAIPARLVRLLHRWQAAGNQVVGLQVDFDAATHRLDEYGEFLQRLRAQLPAEFKLGVTGLLDWAKTGNVATLNRLPVDELVIQSYQGRHTVSNYSAYLPSLMQLRIPFRLGLVQHGRWSRADEQALHASEWYRGTVVFMLNSPPVTPPAVHAAPQPRGSGCDRGTRRDSR